MDLAQLRLIRDLLGSSNSYSLLFPASDKVTMSGGSSSAIIRDTVCTSSGLVLIGFRSANASNTKSEFLPNSGACFEEKDQLYPKYICPR